MYRPQPSDRSTDFEGAPVTVGTSAIELTFTGSTKAIHLQLDHDDTGHVFIGKSNVTNLGANAMARLNAGESIGLNLDDLANGIYVVASAADQTVYKMALI